MKLNKMVVLIVAAGIARDLSHAQTWTQAANAPSAHWTSIACSADGSKLVAGNLNFHSNQSYFVWDGSIYISTNFGASWIQSTNAPPAGWILVASSADGNSLVAVAVGGSVYVSKDSGTTWIPTNTPSSLLNCIASSADGKTLVAGEWNNFDSNPSLIFTSTNSGTTWATNNSPSEYWTSIASSADGTKLVAVGTNPDNACPIYTSDDSGSHWYMTASPQTNWSSVASSADGSKLIAAVNGGNVYTSMDSGTNWTPVILPSADWYFVASSADGTKLVAAQDYNGSIYTSTDSGLTWLSADVPSEYWRSVSSSADGNKLVAVSYQGLVYTFNTTPMVQLNIKPTSAHLVLSWIIPSTYFVLQQSSNLISWDDVTNSPLFNFTNMQNQVSLSPTNVNSFFRLSMH